MRRDDTLVSWERVYVMVKTQEEMIAAYLGLYINLINKNQLIAVRTNSENAENEKSYCSPRRLLIRMK